MKHRRSEKTKRNNKNLVRRSGWVIIIFLRKIACVRGYGFLCRCSRLAGGTRCALNCLRMRNLFAKKTRQRNKTRDWLMVNNPILNVKTKNRHKTTTSERSINGLQGRGGIVKRPQRQVCVNCIAQLTVFINTIFIRAYNSNVRTKDRVTYALACPCLFVILCI